MGAFKGAKPKKLTPKPSQAKQNQTMGALMHAKVQKPKAGKSRRSS